MISTKKSKSFWNVIAVPILMVISFGSAYAQPNILFIISDDLNTKIGPYMDIDQHTPNLDRLARKGVRFDRTYCQYPLCGPSRASLMSGLYTETNGVLGNSHVLGSYRAVTPTLSKHPSMAGFFREHGYFTARVSKIYHMGVPGGIERGEPGGDDPDSWDFATNIMGPETLSDGELELLSPGNLHYGSNFASMVLRDELAATQTDYLATSQAIAILENRAATPPLNGTNKQKPKPKAPFFLAVGLVRPHVPLIAPENCFSPYSLTEIELPTVDIGNDVPEDALRMQNHRIWKMSMEQQKKTIQAYMASIRFMDQQVGRLLDALDRLNLREETIVVFVSDHGYNLGEHDCWAKTSLWEGTVRVPMIIAAPGYSQSEGTTNASISELIDLYPTLIDLAGLSAHTPKILQGTSLVPAISNGDVLDKKAAYSVSQKGKAASIRTDRWRYTCWDQEISVTKEELYDHHQDPEELKNLVTDPKYKSTLSEMRALLAAIRKKAQAKI